MQKLLATLNEEWREAIVGLAAVYLLLSVESKTEAAIHFGLFAALLCVISTMPNPRREERRREEERKRLTAWRDA